MEKENQSQSSNQPINQNKIIKKIKPLSSYEKPTLKGLQNIGKTSYINCILQILVQTEELTNYFLDKDLSSKKILNNNIAIKNKDKAQISPLYLELVQQLWDKNNYKGNYTPEKFVETLNKMAPFFELGHEGDPKNFLKFILEQLHIELKKIDNIKNNNNNNFNDQQYKNKNFKFNNFINEISKERSIISDIFFRIEESNFNCNFCKKNYLSQGKNFPISYNYSSLDFLIFPLENTNKFKFENIKKNNMNLNQINSVTIMDCFNFIQKTELLTGSNMCFCGICKQNRNFLITTKRASSAKVLILVLSRGRNHACNVKFNFTEIIDITEFVSLKKGKLIYKLYGVVGYLRDDDNKFKFFSFCKSPIDNKWYRYDDSVVTDVKNFQKEVIDFENPYILFYKKDS